MTLTVPESCPEESTASKLKLSAPEKLGEAVYVKEPSAFSVSDPPPGPDTSLAFRPLPMSPARTPGALTLSVPATGTSYAPTATATGITLIVTVAGAEFSPLELTVR